MFEQFTTASCTVLTEPDGQKMIEKKEMSAATDSFAFPRFCPPIVLPKWVCLSIPFRRQTRKKGGGVEEKVGETDAGPLCAAAGKKTKEVTCG